MILDARTGLTLEDAFKFMRLLVRENKENLNEVRDVIQADYPVSDEALDALEAKINAARKDINREGKYAPLPDETIDALENKQDLDPNDIRTLARAVGMDYELLMSKDLAPDFQDRFNSAVQNMYNIRRQYRLSKPEVQNGL